MDTHSRDLRRSVAITTSALLLLHISLVAAIFPQRGWAEEDRETPSSFDSDEMQLANPEAQLPMNRSEQLNGNLPKSILESVKVSREKWRIYLQGIETGISPAEVAERLGDRYRDRGIIHVGGSGATVEIYLVDDFTELRFGFSIDKGLLRASVADRSNWLRFPDGQLMTFPYQQSVPPQE
jgi:hypothetical protein